MDLGERYRRWQQRSRAFKEARLLLREGRRVNCKYGHRLNAAEAGEVRAAIDALDGAVRARDYEAVKPALNTLDRQLDEHLAFARKSTTREYIESIAVAVLIALFLRAFVVEAFKIPSGSMIPTLQVGDHIFVNKFIYGIRLPWTNFKLGMSYRTPRRGEVIVFVYPRDPDKDFIKRIVAVEGDVVEMRDNRLYVNGAVVPRRHLDGDCRYEDFLEEYGRWEDRTCEGWEETVNGQPYTTISDRGGAVRSFPAQRVPPKSVFVMGDNRDNSSDSRVWGYVPFELIKGKAMVIWWSIGNIDTDEDSPWLVRAYHAVRGHRLFTLVH